MPSPPQPPRDPYRGRALTVIGPVVTMEAGEFLDLLRRIAPTTPLVARSEGGGWWHNRYRYLCNHKGLLFFTDTAEPIELPQECEVIVAKDIAVP